MIRVALVSILIACGGGSKTPDKEDGKLPRPDDAGAVLPPAPPLPRVPDSLPKPELPEFVTAEAVSLGELLVWDARLSINNRTSCATCHDPAHGYAGGKRHNTASGRPRLCGRLAYAMPSGVVSSVTPAASAVTRSMARS